MAENKLASRVKNRIVKIGTDEIELPGTLTDEQIRETLRPLYPHITNATRHETGNAVEYRVEMGTKG